MIKKKMALLGAVATLGMVGGGFVSPAQAIAIKYDVRGDFAAGGTITGSFDFDATTNAYQNINLSSDSNGTTYTSANSTVVSGSATGLTLRLNDIIAPSFQGLFFSYTAALPTIIGNSVQFIPYTLDPNTGQQSGSREVIFISGTGGFSVTEGVTGGVITAVPWETDALSVIGVTTLFGFGVWTKRKRKVDVSK